MILLTLSRLIFNFDLTTSTFWTCYWALDFVTFAGGFLSFLLNNEPIKKVLNIKYINIKYSIENYQFYNINIIKITFNLNFL